MLKGIIILGTRSWGSNVREAVMLSDGFVSFPF